MDKMLPNGVWPVMLTPFQENGEVDFDALGELVEWYIKEGVSGLFPVAQSGEMFFLTKEESVAVAEFVVKKSAGRVPVIASGHVAETLEEQVVQIKNVAATGVEAVILITNRLAGEDESDEIWLENMKRLLAMIPENIHLGMYECPYPYKRVLTPELIKWCANTGRFYFVKDTSCDMDNIRGKLEACRGTNLKIYNAHTTTLLESLRAGVAGYSGVMGNMQCELYVAMCERYTETKMEVLSDILSACSLIEHQCYPVNAKYYLQLEGLSLTTKCRVKDDAQFSEIYMRDVVTMRRLTKRLKEEYL